MFRMTLMAAATVAALGLTGCAGTQPSDVDALRDELQDREQEAARLRGTVDELQMSLKQKDEILASRGTGAAMPGGDLLPPDAKPGECYARVFMPPQYQDERETVVRREAARNVRVLPARYGTVSKQILVREASEQLNVVPARYEWVEEQVMVSEASERIEVIPARYETRTEQVLVQPAYTTWKKGRGPIEKIDEATGEIMCLVEVPAVYETVSTRVMVSEPSTRKIPVPAVYRTVKKRVMVEPPKTVKVDIPAEYKTVQVKEMVEAPREVVEEIPAEYQQITKRKLVREGRLEWRPILCETNTTRDVIIKLQQALRDKGYYKGPIDGIVGRQT
ncbi:MAG: hypothetical protein KDK91_26915, partial [Gammaproteobacteria bacterium]|nr:hypothetical protein [Gammaproteobacteria bacterium]